jgi:FKBP-type peptidyl-prolyl cis-trans isomerase SlpA
MNPSVVGKGKRITLHFALKLEGGELVDSTFDKMPATFDFGDGNLPDNFCNLLTGMKAGDKAEFKVMPEQAFGQYNPNNVQRIKKDQFEEIELLQPGMMILFLDASKSEVPGVVAEIEDTHVVVDFNHPLAGKILFFEAEIIRVEDAVPEVG